MIMDRWQWQDFDTTDIVFRLKWRHEGSPSRSRTETHKWLPMISLCGTKPFLKLNYVPIITSLAGQKGTENSKTDCINLVVSPERVRLVNSCQVMLLSQKLRSLHGSHSRDIHNSCMISDLTMSKRRKWQKMGLEKDWSYLVLILQHFIQLSSNFADSGLNSGLFASPIYFGFPFRKPCTVFFSRKWTGKILYYKIMTGKDGRIKQKTRLPRLVAASKKRTWWPAQE